MYGKNCLTIIILASLFLAGSLAAETLAPAAPSSAIDGERRTILESFVPWFDAIDAAALDVIERSDELYAALSQELGLVSSSTPQLKSGSSCKVACQQAQLAVTKLNLAKSYANTAVLGCSDPNSYAAQAKYFADVAYSTAVFAANLTCTQHPSAAAFLANTKTRAASAAFNAQLSFAGGCAVSQNTASYAMQGHDAAHNARTNILNCP